MKKNVFIYLLHLLDVKFNYTSTSKYYEQHPYKHSLYGLSNMLKDYGVSNRGVRITDKNDLLKLPLPFIANFSNEFVLVTKITSGDISFLWRDRIIKINIAQFNESWSGIVLLADKSESSMEPNYKPNLIRAWYKRGLSVGLLLSTIILSAFLIQIEVTHHLFFLLFINIVGIYVGCLLNIKQLHIKSAYTEKLCSLFHKSDCNNVLESPVSQIFGVFGWSEIGLGYFISNSLILLFFPKLISYLAFINIFCLPYSFWSIWYQWQRVKQWCPLCIIVQVLLWSIFLVNLLSGFVKVPILSIESVLLSTCIYLIPFILISLSTDYLSRQYKADQVKYELNSLKMRDEIFICLLKK